jgi:type IV secretory pathway VirB6-like protein
MLKKLLIILLTIICISSCTGGEDSCFGSDSDAYDNKSTISNSNSVVAEVYADGSDSNQSTNSLELGLWVASGMSVLQGDLITIRAEDTIILAPPYGLSNSYSGGSNMAGSLGDPAQSNQLAPYTALLGSAGDINSITSFYQNNGLGAMFVIKANANNPYVITATDSISQAFNFAANQLVTITSKSCATGDANSSQPTKWTWDNGWKYSTVRCDPKGNNRSPAINYIQDATAHYQQADPGCVAVAYCNPNAQKESDRYKGWACHQRAKINMNFSQDSCSSYNCETNFNAGASGNCYAGNSYTHDSGSGHCKGRHKAGGNFVSDERPNCNQRDSTENLTPPSFNSCGITDSCWNTNGYLLYGFQTGDVCSGTNNTCTHLNQSQNGKQMIAKGGPIYLKILDPNSSSSSQIIDVTAVQTQFNNNLIQIASISASQDSLNASLYNNLITINGYSGLSCSSIMFNSYQAQNYINGLNCTSGNGATTIALQNIATALNNLSTNCNNFVTQVLPSSNSSAYSTSLSNVQNALSNLTTSVSSLNTTSSSTCPTPVNDNDPISVSSNDLLSYKTSLSTSLQTLTNNANNFSKTLPAIRMTAASYLPNTTGATNLALNNIISNLNSMQLMLNNGNTNLTDYTNDCFSKQIDLSYTESNENSIAWVSSLNNIQTQNNSLINLINEFAINSDEVVGSDGVTPDATIASNLQNFKNTILTSMSSSLGTAVNTAQNNNNSIVTNNNTISSLEAQNATLSAQILAANSSSGSHAIGGYTVYVKADPITASDGQYLSAVISDQDPNIYPNASMVDLGTVTAFDSTPPIVASQAGNIWLKINDPDNNYNNNLGSYRVYITKKNDSDGASTIFSKIINTIRNKMLKYTAITFNKMVCANVDPSVLYSSNGSVSNKAPTTCNIYITTLHLLLKLYVIIFGMFFLFGIIRMNYYDFLIRVMKIGLIITLFNPNAFNLFYNYGFLGFYNASNSLISMAAGVSTVDPFAILGQSIAVLLLDSTTALKILSFLFQGLLGIIYFILLVYGTICFITAIIHAFGVYMMSLVGLSICFILAPIFIPFILFDRTKYLYDNWFQAMMRFTIEPIILFMGIFLFNNLLVVLINQIFNFFVCSKCTIPFQFSIPGVFSLGDGVVFCITFLSPWGLDNLGSGKLLSNFLSIPVIINFCVVTKIMDIYSRSISRKITNAIVTGSSTPSQIALGKMGPAAQMGFNPFDHMKSTIYDQPKELAEQAAKKIRSFLDTNQNKDSESLSSEETTSQNTSVNRSTAQNDLSNSSTPKNTTVNKSTPKTRKITPPTIRP